MHGLVIVIVEPDLETEAIGPRIDQLMAPYECDTEVEPYEDDCYCLDDGRESPDPSCSECGGTGRMMSTLNPYGTWDWYLVGGRWDGAIQGELRYAEDLTLLDFVDESHRGVHNQIENNTVRVGDLPDTLEYFAFVTPDGEWHDGPWWDETKAADWPRQWKEIVRPYPDHVAVAVDIHFY